MRATALPVLLQLQEKVGYPYTLISPDMYRWAAGGGGGWGTICGTVAAGACVINLAVPFGDIGKVVGELFGWYAETALPTKNHEAYAKFPNQVQSVATTPLCHASVSNWCAASGFKEGSKERLDRCAKLCGDVAAKTIELLNDYHSGKLAVVYNKVNPEAQSCFSCHVEGRNDTLTKMNCLPCHDNPHKK